MPYAEKRRLEKERKIKNDAAKCRKMNEFFTVDNMLQDGEANIDRPNPVRPTTPEPQENPVQIQNTCLDISKEDHAIEIEDRQSEMIPEGKNTQNHKRILQKLSLRY